MRGWRQPSSQLLHIYPQKVLETRGVHRKSQAAIRIVGFCVNNEDRSHTTVATL